MLPTRAAGGHRNSSWILRSGASAVRSTVRHFPLLQLVLVRCVCPDGCSEADALIRPNAESLRAPISRKPTGRRSSRGATTKGRWQVAGASGPDASGCVWRHPRSRKALRDEGSRLRFPAWRGPCRGFSDDRRVSFRCGSRGGCNSEMIGGIRKIRLQACVIVA